MYTYIDSKTDFVIKSLIRLIKHSKILIKSLPIQICIFFTQNKNIHTNNTIFQSK